MVRKNAAEIIGNIRVDGPDGAVTLAVSGDFESRRNKSRNKQRPMEASRKPPCGRKEMEGPPARPQLRHVGAVRKVFECSRRFASPETARSSARAVKKISKVSVSAAAA